jgi:hypothetical protein
MKKIIYIILAVIILGGLGFYVSKKTYNPVVQTQKAQLTSFEIVKPNLEARGENLSKVEIWAIPTGTEITAANYFLLGNATLRLATSSPNGQIWDFSIPQNPVLATEIFARGYDSQGNQIEDESLPISGATDIYNSLWAPQSNSGNITIWDNTRTFSYSLTSRFAVEFNAINYPKKNFAVSPVGIIGEISNIPPVAQPNYVVRYEGIKTGKTVIKNGDFSVNINIFDSWAGDKTYNNSQYGFSFNYPASDILNPNIDYQFITDNSLARVDLPQNDFIDTNLGEAAFIVGASKASSSLAGCLQLSSEEQTQDDDQAINGISFKVFEGGGAGAGNIYETKSYRTVQNNTCYEVTALIHYGNIFNYSPGTVMEFDKTKAMSGLQEIADTFKINP